METPEPDFSNTTPDPYGLPSGTPAPASVHLGDPDVQIQDVFVTVISVSYTHLTLPTILLV